MKIDYQKIKKFGKIAIVTAAFGLYAKGCLLMHNRILQENYAYPDLPEKTETIAAYSDINHDGLADIILTRKNHDEKIRGIIFYQTPDHRYMLPEQIDSELRLKLNEELVKYQKK